MAERVDHFARMRGEPEPEGATEVAFTPDQLEYLEVRFGGVSQLAVLMGHFEKADDMVHERGRCAGWAQVLDHIRTLVKVTG